MMDEAVHGGAVVAVAGRRIDAPGTDPARFPRDRIEAVRRGIAAVLAAEQAASLVASAACGADILALEEAERLGLRRRIVLPFPPERFRRTSVTDRPGDWGATFDRLVRAAELCGDLVVLNAAGDDDAAYAAATAAILREAEELARTKPGLRRVALVAWEGKPRDGTDATDEFRRLALAQGFVERVVLTR